MNQKAALLAIVLAVVVISVSLIVLTHGDDDGGSDVSGMYRGYDAYYDYTTSGSDSSTYASHLVSVVADGDTIYLQSALEGYPLRTIGPEALAGCKANVVVVPDTVVSVDERFLDGSDIGTLLFLGDSPEGMDPEEDRVAFVGPENSVTMSVDGFELVFLIIDGGAVLIESTGEGGISIPGSVFDSGGTQVPVTAVGCEAFRGTGVTSAVFPESVERVMCRAFYGCEELMSVSMSGSLEAVEDEAFRMCTSLSSPDLDGVQFIGFEAFRDCHAIVSIVIPDSVGFMGDGAFYICTSAKDVTVGSGLSEIPSRAFGYCNSLVSVDLGGHVNSLGPYSFVMCQALEGIDLHGVRTIGDNAFNECRALSSLEMDSVESVGSRALYNCRSLAEVWFPASLRQLDDAAFMGCNWLSDAWFLGPMPVMVGDPFAGVTCTIHVTESLAGSWSGFDGVIETFR